MLEAFSPLHFNIEDV